MRGDSQVTFCVSLWHASSIGHLYRRVSDVMLLAEVLPADCTSDGAQYPVLTVNSPCVHVTPVVGHSSHRSPSSDTKKLSGQVSHVVASTARAPAPHDSHDDRPLDDATMPDGQSRHVVDAAVGEYVPAPHRWQEPPPETMYDPASHSTHAERPSDAQPVGQGRHMVRLAARSLPGGEGTIAQ